MYTISKLESMTLDDWRRLNVAEAEKFMFPALGIQTAGLSAMASAKTPEDVADAKSRISRGDFFLKALRSIGSGYLNEDLVARAWKA